MLVGQGAGPTSGLRPAPRTTEASIEFQELEAQTPAAACELPRDRHEVDEPPPAPDPVPLLPEEVVEVDPATAETPDPPSDERVTPPAPGSAHGVPEIPQPPIALRVRPPRTAAVPPAAAPAAPPSAPTSAPGERGRVVTPPGPLATNRAPEYPFEARAAGFEGVVVLRVTVRADGSVETVWLLASSGHAALDRAAESAVRGWGFSPPRVDGAPVSMSVDVPLAFHLR